MSTVVPPKGHRHTRSAAVPSATSSSQNPLNPHHLNMQAHAQNSQSEMNNPVPPTTPPRTPRRENQYQTQPPNPTNSAAPENGSKQKSRNKNRPKNVMTSPAVTRNDRNTPPLTGAQSAGMPSSSVKPINTPSTAAYAGPTFHASPAPSALPIPSFYSKSVPESPGVKGLKTLKDNSSSGESPTPPAAAPSNNQFQREESPLDVFFKADREEKARARSASSTHAAATTAGPFQPPSGSPRTSQTPPATNSQNRARQSQANRVSASGMFAMELDGPSGSGIPYGPAFSTPYSERINAAKSTNVPSRSLEQTSQNSQQSIDRSEALKAYLFSGQSLPAAAPVKPQSVPGTAPVLTPNKSTSYLNTTVAEGGLRNNVFPPRSQQSNYPYAHDNKFSNNVARTSGRASGLRQEVTPTGTPTKTPDRSSSYAHSPTSSRIFGNASSDANVFTDSFTSHGASPATGSSNDVLSSRSADLQGMEDSLRKILKLDSGGSSRIIESGVGSVPAAAVSAPNYVGGRPPPLNGMHNGVMGS